MSVKIDDHCLCYFLLLEQRSDRKGDVRIEAEATAMVTAGMVESSTEVDRPAVFQSKTGSLENQSPYYIDGRRL